VNWWPLAAAVAMALAFGLTLWLGFRAARRQGSAEADRSRLTEDIDRATQANQARASVDRLDDAAVRDELRKFQRD
jgi:hypothetical protein